jgi:hypothetical protein
MATLKSTTDRIAGKSKEAVAEIIGDGKLREEGKAQQRRADAETDEPVDANPLKPLTHLTLADCPRLNAPRRDFPAAVRQ